MNIPILHGVIDRRILVNYSIDPVVTAKIIPAPFRVKTHNGAAVGGICLIRLKQVKPKYIPGSFGISSENAAHRFAVEWDEDGVVKEGVYIPRRDTSSLMNSIAGGRLFPGKHHHAKFDVSENTGNYNIAFTSKDGTGISLKSNTKEQFYSKSLFSSIEDASCFFQNGAVGCSPGKGKYDGLLLNTYQWKVSPLEVTEVQSSFFEDKTIFPEGSVQFDNALLMRNIEHEWISICNKQ